MRDSTSRTPTSPHQCQRKMKAKPIENKNEIKINKLVRIVDAVQIIHRKSQSPCFSSFFFHLPYRLSFHFFFFRQIEEMRMPCWRAMQEQWKSIPKIVYMNVLDPVRFTYCSLRENDIAIYIVHALSLSCIRGESPIHMIHMVMASVTACIAFTRIFCYRSYVYAEFILLKTLHQKRI